MSYLEFYCRWSSTVACKVIFKHYLKYWGSTVGGVFCFCVFVRSSTVAIPMVQPSGMKFTRC
jgi:hypothetical protein